MSGMMLYRVDDGFLFKDDFSTLNSRWTPSPMGYYSITERPGFLRLKHHVSQDTMLLADITEENLAFEVQADFLPTVAGDEGGVLIWNNSTETIEFLESFDAYSSVDQKAWLVVKEGQNWRFFSDSGGGYDFVDSDVMDSTKFGVMLKRGSDPSFTNMDVNSILATKGNKITVNNVLAGYRVQILNGDGTVAAEDVVGSGATAIKLQIMKLEINGTLNIFDETGTLVDTVQAIFHGGDIYSLGSEIQVRIDTTELSRIQQTDLGSMSSGYLQVKMNLYNPSNVAATNIKLAIEQYDSKFGWTWVDIALDVSGNPSTYQDTTLSIASLAANSEIFFWVKVTKGNDYMGFEPLQFNIHLEHD